MKVKIGKFIMTYKEKEVKKRFF